MTLDALLNIAITVVLPFLMALGGGILAARSLQSEREKRFWIFGFVLVFLLCVALSVVQQVRSTTQEASRQVRDSQRDLVHMGNEKYMQGQLDSINRVLASLSQNSTPDKTLSLLKSLMTATAPPTLTKTEYGALNNVQLQNAAFKLANDLRELEAQEQAEEYQSGDARMSAIRRATTEVEKSGIWDQYNNLDEQRRLTYQTRFRKEFFGAAVALRDELLLRIPDSSRIKPQYPIFALDNGSLAGASPLAEVATYIEALARRLPVK